MVLYLAKRSSHRPFVSYFGRFPSWPSHSAHHGESFPSIVVHPLPPPCLRQSLLLNAHPWPFAMPPIRHAGLDTRHCMATRLRLRTTSHRPPTTSTSRRTTLTTRTRTMAPTSSVKSLHLPSRPLTRQPARRLLSSSDLFSLLSSTNPVSICSNRSSRK